MPTHSNDTLKCILREAKVLHRAATSDSLSQALPVLRRLLATDTIRNVSLPELHRGRGIIQRKHVLRMLALEAGYGSWEDYRKVLPELPPEAIGHFDILRRTAGYPNVWFSTFPEAQAYAKAQGGRALRVGQQAVVLVNNGQA